MARDDRPRIGRQLRRAMERARLDQNQIASALGVSRGAVNAWLNDRAYPMNSLGALEELLGVTFDDDGEDAPQEVTTDVLKDLVKQLSDRVDRVERELRRGQGNAPGDRNAI